MWSNLCICSPGVVELVRSNLAPDFPLFHDLTPLSSSTHNNYNCTAPSLLPHQGGPSLPQEVTRGEWEVTRLLAWAGDTL